jgi:FOG: FHA domain
MGGQAEPYQRPDDNTRVFKEPKTTGYLINQKSSNVYKLFNDSVIGRGQSSLSDAQKISVEGDEYISRSHARIIFDKTRHKISDSSSKTGTFVNGEKIRGWVTLEESDIIRIGKTNLKYTKNK